MTHSDSHSAERLLLEFPFRQIKLSPMALLNNHRNLRAIASVFALILFATFYKRYAFSDEGIQAEMSYRLLHSGRVYSEFFSGLLGYEKQMYVFHKLHVWIGAGWMAIFGASLLASKTTSLIPAAGLVYLFWKYFQLEAVDLHDASRVTTAKTKFYVCLILLLLNGLFIEFSFINRPEMWVIFLGFASFYFLEKKRFALAGMCAGISVVAHLNGVIYILAGVMALGYRAYKAKTLSAQLKNIVVFGVASTLAASLYFIDSLSIEKMRQLLYQFRYDPATVDAFSIAGKLGIMADYHMMFFHSVRESALSLLALVVALTVPKNTSKNFVSAGTYSLLLISIFFFLTKSNFYYYQLLFVPFLLVFIAESIVNASTLDKPLKSNAQKAVMFFLFLYVLGGVAWSIKTVRENLLTPYLPTHNALLAGYMPEKGVQIVAPSDFFYEQVGNFKILCILGLNRVHPGINTTDQFFHIAEETGARYVLLDYKIDEKNGTGHYRKIFSDNWNSLYQLNH